MQDDIAGDEERRRERCASIACRYYDDTFLDIERFARIIITAGIFSGPMPS